MERVMILKGKHILIVDDEVDICSLISMMLKLEGCQSTSVYNLADARKMAGTHVYDAILTDIRLPDGNGVEWMREVKNQLGIAAPALIVTTGFSHFSPEEIFENGADEFIEKPFDAGDLMAALKRAVEKSIQRKSAAGLVES
jgi:DNA-binding response OmpR family regulator